MNQELNNKEKTIIIGVQLNNDNIDIENSMDELEELVNSAGGEVCFRAIQKKKSIDPAYFIGKGKALEIKDYCNEYDIDTVVFNDELSGSQIRNLEELIDRKIVDRTNLILDIFALRASSREGKLQVKLAQLKYRLPRLVGYRNYLSRQGGGIGTRGPGEQKLETDRRHLLREITNVEKALEEVEKTRDIKRKRRVNSTLPIVALVGYTNAGKSTILNKIIDMYGDKDESKMVFTDDMLFATLDTSLRRAKLPNGQEFLITDTVGFVSKLPTHLVEAFKGTLEEVKYADLLLHIVDASNKNLDMQIETTLDILKDLEVLDKPTVTVFNKMDKVDDKNLVFSPRYVDKKLFISSMNTEDIEKLLNAIQENLPMEYTDVKISVSYKHQSVVNYFLKNYEMRNVEYTENGVNLDFNISSNDLEKYNEYINEYKA